MSSLSNCCLRCCFGCAGYVVGTWELCWNQCVDQEDDFASSDTPCAYKCYDTCSHVFWTACCWRCCKIMPKPVARRQSVTRPRPASDPLPSLFSHIHSNGPPLPARPISHPIYKSQSDALERDFASFDELFPDLPDSGGGERAFKALSLASATVPVPEVNTDGRILVVPSLRDEIQYEYLDTTYKACKMCLENEKEVRLEPCGHFLCTPCLDTWKEKWSRLNDTGSGGADPLIERICECPYCKTDVKTTQNVCIQTRLDCDPSGSDRTQSYGAPVKKKKEDPSKKEDDEGGTRFPLPSYWTTKLSGDEISNGYQKVELDMLSDEAKQISKDFKGTDMMGIRILGITRIENPTLWQAYSMHKSLMMARPQTAPPPPRAKATWEVETDSGWSEYDSATAATLEKSFRNMLPLCTFSARGYEYEVILSTNGHTQRNTSTNKVRKVKRWAPYSIEVERRDAKAMAEQKNESVYLYHGTDESALPKIVQYGFNRSFAGKNGTQYGKGVYFAKESQYSSQSKYAPLSTNGEKNVLMCRVLTGDYTIGDINTIVPDVCDYGSGRLYDSTVDNTADPKIFVTYHDSQAYPEYLVKFR